MTSTGGNRAEKQSLWAGLDAMLSQHGLCLRGGLLLDPEAETPASLRGAACTLALVGQVGAANWPHLEAWLGAQGKRPPNPLDTWSRGVIEMVANEVGARAVFPSDKPYLPFQQWAMRAEGLKPSPLGILIHPEYGLWHAYRGALLFDGLLDLPPETEPHHPCDSCVEKPCLTTCPVNAFSGSGYDVPACVSHVTGEAGNTCRQGGCLARNACPVGAKYRYPAEVQAFHMAAFVANHRQK